MAKSRSPKRDLLVLKLAFRKSPTDVTDSEIAYFREHPDEIDEITAPINIHMHFLWFGMLLGAILLGISKVLKYSTFLVALHQGVREFVLDLISEVGIALIGAAIIAYTLGIVLNKQQENAAAWRAEIRSRIGGGKVSE